jgi:hypothetical protein
LTGHDGTKITEAAALDALRERLVDAARGPGEQGRDAA